MIPQRTITAYITLGQHVELEGLCPDCLHATMVRFDLHLMSELGVTKLSKYLTVCVHCHEAENGAEDERGEDPQD